VMEFNFEKSYVEVFVYDEVLVFDVAVGDPALVEVMYGLDNLGENVPRLVLGEAPQWRLFYALEEVV
jgi:hypothetical protein